VNVPPVPTHEDALHSLIQVSKHLMEKSLNSSQGTPSQGTTASLPDSPESQRQTAMKSLLEEAKSLQDALSIFPERFHSDLHRELDCTAKQYIKAARREARESEAQLHGLTQ
jgi:hypothetical protein